MSDVRPDEVRYPVLGQKKAPSTGEVGETKGRVARHPPCSSGLYDAQNHPLEPAPPRPLATLSYYPCRHVAALWVLRRVLAPVHGSSAPLGRDEGHDSRAAAPCFRGLGASGHYRRPLRG